MAQAPDFALQHQADRAGLADATANAVAQMWANVDPDNIAESWTAQIPEATIVVSGAQLASAEMAEEYLAEAAVAEGFGEAEAAVRAAGFAGLASDGRSLVSLLYQPVIGSLLAMKSDAGVPMAMASGHATLRMIAQTQVADAGRLGDSAGIVARIGIQGYVRVVSGNACSRCIVLAGKFYRWSSAFLRHPHCHCSMLPANRATGFVQDPRALFNGLTARERSLAGWSKADQKALEEGADISQVTNVRRKGAVYTAGGREFTREGTGKSGVFGGFDVDPETGRMIKRPAGERARRRLTVDQIYVDAGGDRDEAIRLLQENGYLFGKPAKILGSPITMPIGLDADPALKMTVAQLKQLARDANVPLFGATKKADIVAAMRDRESVYRVKIPGLPEWKPPQTETAKTITAPSLGKPAQDAHVLTGDLLNDWADYLKYDLQYGRHQFVNAAGNTAAEGVPVRNLRTEFNAAGDYVAAHGTAWRFDGVAYLIEHRPGEEGSAWVSTTLADLREAHAKIPGASRVNSSYAAVSGASPGDAYWQAKFKNPNHKAAMSAGSGHITIWHFNSPYARVNWEELRHETGHNLDHFVGRTTLGSDSPEWSTAASSDVKASAKITDLSQQAGFGGFGEVEPGRGFPEGVSVYGRSSPAEDYAESMRYYLQGVIAQGRLKADAEFGPVYFRDLYPARAKILDRQFPEIAKAQEVEIKALRTPKPAPVAMPIDLAKLKVPELKALAKGRGIAGYSKLTKPQLLERLAPVDGSVSPGKQLLSKPKGPLNPRRKAETAMSKAAGTRKPKAGAVDGRPLINNKAAIRQAFKDGKDEDGAWGSGGGIGSQRGGRFSPDEGGYQAHLTLARKLGFDGLPRIVTDADEWERLKGDARADLFRGWGWGTDKKGTDLADQFLHGQLHVGGGIGLGTNMSNDIWTAEHYASQDRWTRIQDSAVYSFLLRGDAKVAEYTTITREHQAFLAALPNTTDGRMAKAVFEDVGTFAMAKGYDAMVVREGDVILLKKKGVDEWVVFNRTKLVAWGSAL